MTRNLQDFAAGIRLPAYRTLTLAQDGQVLATTPLQADDDIQALSLAEAMAHGVAIELWDGLRFIEHFNAIDLAK